MNISYDYLYEIIESYKETTLDEEKNEIFNDFCSFLWNSKNKRRVYTKTIKFKVRDDLLDSDIGKIFDAWSVVEYKGYKPMSKEEDWCSLIRQKINNLYTRYCDKDVILNKEYMNLLKTPKTLYYRWIKGYEINIENLTEIIDNAIIDSEDIKIKYQNQKMDISWSEYKKLIESFLIKIFNNCITINEYESKYGVPKYWMFNEFSIEDNFYIKYICKSLESYMRNYQKNYYGLYVPSSTKQNKQYKRCKECGALIEKTGNKKMYCDECAKKNTKNNWKKASNKYRNKAS